MLVAYLDFSPMTEDDNVTYTDISALTANSRLPIVGAMGSDMNAFFAGNAEGTNQEFTVGDKQVAFTFYKRAPEYSADATTDITGPISLFGAVTGQVNPNAMLLGATRMRTVGDCSVFGGPRLSQVDMQFSIANRYGSNTVTVADSTVIESGAESTFACFSLIEGAPGFSTAVCRIEMNSLAAEVFVDSGNSRPASLDLKAEYPDTAGMYEGDTVDVKSFSVQGGTGPIGAEWRKEFTGYLSPCNRVEVIGADYEHEYIDPNTYHRNTAKAAPKGIAVGFIASGAEVEDKCALGLSVLGNFSKFSLHGAHNFSQYGIELEATEPLPDSVIATMPAPFKTLADGANTWTDNMNLADFDGFINLEDSDGGQGISSFMHSVVSSANTDAASQGYGDMRTQYRIGQYASTMAVDPVISLEHSVHIKRYDSYHIATAGNVCVGYAYEAGTALTNTDSQLRQVKEIFPSVPCRLSLTTPTTSHSLGQDKWTALYGFAPYNSAGSAFGLENSVPAYVYELRTRTSPRLMANCAVIRPGQDNKCGLPRMQSSQVFSTVHDLSSDFSCYPRAIKNTPPTDYDSRVDFHATVVGMEATEVQYAIDEDTGVIIAQELGVSTPEGWRDITPAYSVVAPKVMLDGAASDNVYAMDFTTAGRLRRVNSLAHTCYLMQTVASPSQ